MLMTYKLTFFMQRLKYPVLNFNGAISSLYTHLTAGIITPFSSAIAALQNEIVLKRSPTR